MEEPGRLHLRSLLTRAEAAAPAGVVDAMAAALQEMLDARDVSFLIADFSGRSLNRLGHTVVAQEGRAAQRGDLGTGAAGGSLWRGARGPALRAPAGGGRHARARPGDQPRRGGRRARARAAV